MKNAFRAFAAWLIAVMAFTAVSPAARALEIYELPEGLTAIESEAFAGTQLPKNIFIPESCVSIASDAFTDPAGMTVYGFPGSAAEAFTDATGAAFRSVAVTQASLAAPSWASPFVPVTFTASAVSGGELTYAFTLTKGGETVFVSDPSDAPAFSYTFTEGGAYSASVLIQSRYAEAQALLASQITIAEPLKASSGVLFLSVGESANAVSAQETRLCTLTASDPELLEISGTTVTALKLGACTLTISAETEEGTVITPVTVHVIVPPESVTIACERQSLMEGESVSMTCEILPEEADYRDVIWSVSDPEIAEIDENGCLTAKTQGRVTVYARCADAQGEFALTVTRAVREIAIDREDIPETVLTGDTFRMTSAYAPESADDGSVSWLSADEGILIIHPFTGEATARSAGKAIVTAVANDGAGARDEIEITVLQGVDEISFSLSEAVGYPGDVIALTANVLPENAQDTSLIWYSSDESVATVTDTGEITLVSPGACVITAHAHNGTLQTLPLTVLTPVESLECVHSTVYMTPGTTLSAGELILVKPKAAAGAVVSWFSDAPDIVHADEKTGVLSAIRAGSAQITCISENGKSASFTVKSVTDSTVITKIALSPTYGVLTVGASGTITPTASPSGKYMGGTWQVDNEDVLSIVSVDSYKKVTVKALSAGHATLTFVSNSGVIARCPIVVNPIVATSAVMNASSLSLNVGDVFPLAVTCQPENVTADGVTFTSSNPNVVYVSQEGMLRAVKGGNAVITASLEDGAMAACAVTVNTVVMTAASLNTDAITGNAGHYYLPEYTVSPENATPAAFVWTSANSRIASVEPLTGRIRFLNPGSTVVSASALDGSGLKMSVSVTVTETPVTALSVSESDVTLNLGDTLSLSTRILPKDASYSVPIFASSNEKIVSVTQEGLITAHSEGECTITVTAGRGSYRITQKIAVTVLPVNDVTYRALVIGQFTDPTEAGYLPFANNGTVGIRDALSRSVIDGHLYEITRLSGNPSPAAISSAINTLAGKADENDVTVVYLLTHGGYSAAGGYVMQTSSGRDITPSEMIGSIKGISGHVVLILCTCNSGYIFDSSTAKALTSQSGVYTGTNGEGRLSILCASTNTLSSYYRIMDEKASYDFYSYAATRAFGWNMLADGSIGKPLADQNGDGRVTLSEYAAYTRSETQRALSAFVQQNGKTAFSGNVNQFPTWRFAEGEGDLVIFGQ